MILKICTLIGFLHIVNVVHGKISKEEVQDALDASITACRDKDWGYGMVNSHARKVIEFLDTPESQKYLVIEMNETLYYERLLRFLDFLIYNDIKAIDDKLRRHVERLMLGIKDTVNPKRLQDLMLKKKYPNL